MTKSVRRYPLISFFALTFAVTWAIAALLLVFPALPFAPVFFVAVYVPSVSGLVLTGVIGGRASVRELLGRSLKWRVGLRWYLVPLLLFPAIIVLSAIINVSFGEEYAGTINLQDLYLLLPLLLVWPFIDPGPLGEELGWRGFALPRLLDGMGALPASILLGLVWGVWHLPAFFIPEAPQSDFSLPIFLVGTVMLSILMTWVYRSTGGSVLLGGFMMHLSWNFVGTNVGSQLSLNVGSHLNLNIAFLCVVVVAVIIAVGPALISREPEKRVK